MRQLPDWLENLFNTLCRLLSRSLLFLPEPVSLRLANIRLIRRAAIRCLTVKWNGRADTFRADRLGGVIDIAADPAPLPASGPLPTYTVLHGAGQKMAGRRVAIMAHHDPHNMVDPYVVAYLRHLADIGYDVALAACGNIAVTDELRELLWAVVYRKGPGYDFTSWQTVLLAFPDWAEADEILLCNDSVFAPIGSLLPIHQQMDSATCDFWGLCESRLIRQHVQSYYIVFRQTALSSPALKKFWAELRVRDRNEALRAELGWAAALTCEGLIARAYVTCEALPFTNASPIHVFWRQLIERFDIPLLKRDIWEAKLGWIDTGPWREVLQKKGYDLSLIDNYHARTGRDISLLRPSRKMCQ